MTIRTPVWIQTGGETAEDARRATQAAWGNPGIITATDLAVTQHGTPDMSVDVAAGQVILPGTSATGQGYYVVENTATLTLPVSASDPTNARVDLVVAAVQDSQYSGLSNAAVIQVVTGTPAPAPVEQPVPANAWVLATIAVPADASSITNANITDQRTQRAGQYGLAAPRNTARGVLAKYNSAGSGASASTSPVTIASGTFIVGSGTRAVEVNAQGSLQPTAAGDLGRITVNVDGVEVARYQVTVGGAGGAGVQFGSAWGWVALSAGPHTWSATVLRVTGSGTVTGGVSTLAATDIGAG